MTAGSPSIGKWILGVTYWKCAKRTCPTRMITKDEELLQQTAGHNHPVDAVDCQVQAIRNQMRKTAHEEIILVTAMYNEQLISLNTHPERNSIAPKLPSFMSLKSSLYRNRHSRLPPLLKTRDEIRVEGDWTKTLTGENFLLCDDGDSNKILIFGTQENLLKLSGLNTIYVDGYVLQLSFPISPALDNQWLS